MWTAIFSALIACVCIASLIGCVVNVRSAVQERESVLRKQRSTESQLRLLTSGHEELRDIVQEMAESQKMQRVRKATKHAASSSGEPDARLDPEAWRAWKNAQLRAGVFN